MPKTRTKSSHSAKIPPWRRAKGPVLSLIRVGERLVLDFEYAPERVGAIKAIAGARYHPEDKSWSVPLDALNIVKGLKQFPNTALVNALGPLDIEACEPSKAWDELRHNPFSVREEVLASIPVDLVVRFNPEKRRIRMLPRVGSTAQRAVKKVPGALFSAYDSAYILPVEQVAPLLKKLRDKKVAFAIDGTAGAALSGSAELRRAILESPSSFTSEDLSSALLTPFITRVFSEEQVVYRPCFFTTEQFSLAFPGVKRQQGKVWTFDERALLQLVGRLGSVPFPVWFSSEVHKVVQEKREQLSSEVLHSVGVLDDVAADLAEMPLVWRNATSGRGALAIRLPEGSEVRELLVKRLEEVLGCTYAHEGEMLVLEVPDSKLQLAIAEVDSLCEVHGLPRIPRSDSFERLATDTKERTKLRERAAYYTSLNDIPASDIEGLKEEQGARLFPHQRIAVQWLQETPYAFLGDDMGLGKTLSVLSYYSALRATQRFSLLLVVCPNSLTRNWAREAAMWFPELRTSVLAGDKSSKSWALRLLSSGATDCDVLVVNYEAVRLDYVLPELENLAGARTTLLCLDESQRVKNPTAKTFKAISQIAPCAERRVLLSGTPTPKDVSDLWAQMRILDGGARLGKSFYKWLGKVAELGTEYSQYAVKKFHDDEVAESVCRVQEIMLRRRKERVVDLPPKTFSIREVELTGSQAERYEEVREGLILRMRSISGEQFVREITNILEEYLRAVQIASNPRLVDPEWKGEPAKFVELDEIVHEVVHEQGQKIVIWTNYLANVAELCERYKGFGAAAFSGEVSATDRERTVRAFQDVSGEPRILVAIPAAGGVGITLTAAQTAVYIDKTWNAEHWMQSVDRIHRIGQQGTVNVLSLLGCKVDEIIHWNLRRKEQNQAKVLGDIASDTARAHGGITREELLEALEG